MMRAWLEGRHIGRIPLILDRASILQHRAHGQSLSQIANSSQISHAAVSRVLKQERQGRLAGHLRLLK